MTLSDKIQLVGILVSLFTSLIAIIISIFTIRQNSKMLESSLRPYISVYNEFINSGTPLLYLVVKNCGNSQATITKFDCSFDTTNCYSFPTDKDWLHNLVGSQIAPNQSRICRLDYKKFNGQISINVEYKSSTKKYSDRFCFDLHSGDLIVSKTSSYGKELETISYTLQEMLTKHL